MKVDRYLRGKICLLTCCSLPVASMNSCPNHYTHTQNKMLTTNWHEVSRKARISQITPQCQFCKWFTISTPEQNYEQPETEAQIISCPYFIYKMQIIGGSSPRRRPLKGRYILIKRKEIMNGMSVSWEFLDLYRDWIRIL